MSFSREQQETILSAARRVIDGEECPSDVSLDNWNCAKGVARLIGWVPDEERDEEAQWTAYWDRMMSVPRAHFF